MVDIDSGIVNSSNAIGVSYGLTLAQAVGTDAVIKYDTKFFDSDNSFSTVTGLFTCKHPGMYDLTVGAIADVDAVAIYIKVAGAAFAELMVGSTPNGNPVCGCISIPLAFGDTVGFYTDGAANFSAPIVDGRFVNYMSIIRA